MDPSILRDQVAIAALMLPCSHSPLLPCFLLNFPIATCQYSCGSTPPPPPKHGSPGGQRTRDCITLSSTVGCGSFCACRRGGRRRRGPRRTCRRCRNSPVHRSSATGSSGCRRGWLHCRARRGAGGCWARKSTRWCAGFAMSRLGLCGVGSRGLVRVEIMLVQKVMI